jgi:hypothetical protein
LFRVEENSVALNIPLNLIFHIILSNEKLKFILRFNQKHTSHVFNAKTLVCSFSGSSNFISDGVQEFINEKLISWVRQVLFCL